MMLKYARRANHKSIFSHVFPFEMPCNSSYSVILLIPGVRWVAGEREYDACLAELVAVPQHHPVQLEREHQMIQRIIII